MKRCPKCGGDKPVSDFGRDKYRKDGLTTYCKECRRAMSRETARRYAEANSKKGSL